MTVRQTMRRRARVVRPVERDENVLGLGETADEVIKPAMPCRFWSETRQVVLDTDKSAIIVTYRMMVPLRADIQERDRVDEILDRRGRVVHSTPMTVETVNPVDTHQEVFLEGVK